MSTQSFKILFVISGARINKKGLVPLICRITYNGKRKPFSTGLFINPECWFSKKQQAKPPNEENDHINIQISLIKNKLNQAFLFLQVQEENFDVEDIYLQYKGGNTRTQKSVLMLFQEHNDKMEKLIGKDYVVGTFWKFRQARELLKAFIRHQFKKTDYQFEDLDLKFVLDYEFFLKVEKNLSQATINKAIQRFRRIVRIAISEGYLEKEPFMMYKVRRIKKEVVFLSPDELAKLEKYQFAQNRLEQVRDMFVFCCYTGLAFNEMSKLEHKHIVVGFDGNKWIKINREKTKKMVSVPILSQSANIIEKYFSNNNYLLPKISNQKFNSFLKEIALVVGIDKKITHHTARKTYASTVLLYNDVPLEIVSELLGHSKISITQEYYGKIVQKKVSEHMSVLAEKLKR